MTRLTWLALLLVILCVANSISASSTPGDSCKRGTYVDGACVCKPGFFGPDCGSGSGICVEASQEGCVHGTCRDGECICKPGFFGERCEQKGCLNSCSFKGLCFEPADEHAQCLCMYGHFGHDCSQSGCSKDCKHGKCMMSPSGSIRCVCEPGWAGEDCATRVCNSCVNGVCDGVQCVCEPGWTGIDCTKRSCPDCGDRGTCDPLTGQCVCKTPFFNRPGGRTDCSGNEQICPHKCTSENHGICLSSGCQCLPGWGGPDCSQVRCPKDCNNNGLCRLGKCHCKEGFSGPECAVKVCPNQCSGKGFCLNGECHCMRVGSASAVKTLPRPITSISAHLKVNVSQAILAGAVISNHTGVETASTGSPTFNVAAKVATHFFAPLPVSQVDPGFAGQDCGVMQCATDCGESNGQGRCNENLGVCVCNEGWYWKNQGMDCSLRTCARNCNNNGLCVNNECRCLPGFTGVGCDRVVKDLPASQQSFIEQSTLVDEQIRENTYNAENQDRIDQARTFILQSLKQSEQIEADLAADAVRRDAEAAILIETEQDAGIAAQYINAFGSSSASFVHVLATAEGETALQRMASFARLTAQPTSKFVLTPEEEYLRRVLNDTQINYNNEMTMVRQVEKKIADAKLSAGRGCTANCSNRGICIDGICKCRDSFGAYCEQLACPEGCSGHGVCNPKTGQCQCHPGFDGPGCNQSGCNPHNCNNQGKCTMVEEKNKFGVVIASRSKCVCKAGFTGVDCSLPVCEKKCSGRGTCVKNKCFCAKGFAGENCEEGPICEGGCGVNGVCKVNYAGSTDTVSVYCECKQGYTGAQCNQRLCPGDMENKCGDHGICLDNKCVCETGWEGDFCNRRNDCKSCNADGGRCGADKYGRPTCFCNPGFGGADCSSKVCTKDCKGRGKCLNDKCVCEKGWTGDSCEKGCPLDCSSRGECVANINGQPQCKCKDNFYGRGCQYGRCPGVTILSDGKQGFCSGHGACDKANGVCTCDFGYLGDNCAVFNAQSCSNACQDYCRVGQKGAFRLMNQMTGEEELMTPSKCFAQCTTKCTQRANL